MKIEEVLIEELVSDPRNARVHDEYNIAAISASLARFGQQKPIVITTDGIVIAGNGTLEAAKRLTWKTIECVRSELGVTESQAYAIADNKTTDLSKFDDEVLAKLLQEIRDKEAELIAAAGFNEKELADLIEDAVKAIPDYSLLEAEGEGDKEKQEQLAAGVRKAIQIEFAPDEYDAAYDLVAKARKEGWNVGRLLVDKLQEHFQLAAIVNGRDN